MSWETTLNEALLKTFNSTKQIIKNVNILHECKESKDVNKLLRTSIKNELHDNENEESITNLLYS